MGVDQRGAHVVFTENKQTERFVSCYLVTSELYVPIL